MSPPIKPAGQENKSWKKINEERKALKRERRQDRLIREVENVEKLKELAKAQEAEQALRKPEPSTISIAVPGSILENAQSPELRSYLAGQIARAACIFRVNEIIVFDDIGIATAKDTRVVYENETNEAAGEEGDGEEAAVTRTVRASSLQLARILQYLECPQYLRKFFFPLHSDLKYSGIMNPLDTPHHLRQQTVFLYREGVVTEKQAKEGRCFVNVGLLNDVLIDKAIKPGVRVTVKLNNVNESKKLRGIAVSPDEPRRETGVYWGYTVRIAHSLAEIFSKSPYKGGYDCTIGTSDRGSNIQEVEKSSCAYNHLLIVFGGLAGLEAALANDEKLDVEDPAMLFDHYLNVLPKQGSRTIRTEEAVLIAMSALQEKLKPEVQEPEDTAFKELLPRSEDTGIKPVFESLAQTEFPTHRKNPFTKRREQQPEQQVKAAAAENDKEIEHSNPFVNGLSSEARRAQNIANDEVVQSVDRRFADRKSFKRNNPFGEKEHKTQKKFKEQRERGGFERDHVAERNKNDEVREKKSKNITTVDNNEGSDLEVVPANGFMPSNKHKKSKKNADDLSRFD